MSYYTDITRITNASTATNTIAASSLSNTCGDLLESTGYFEIEKYADTSTASSLTNCCSVKSLDNKVRLKLYQNSSSSPTSLAMQIEYIDNGVVTTSYNNFPSIVNGVNPYIINTSFRILHLKRGICLLNGNSPFLTVLTVKNINTNENYKLYSINSVFNSTVSNLAIADGLNIVYATTSFANIKDATNQKQFLFPICFTSPSVPSSGGVYNVMYISEDHFSNAAGMIFQGFVEMNGKVYYCSQVHAYELEDR